MYHNYHKSDDVNVGLLDYTFHVISRMGDFN